MKKINIYTSLILLITVIVFCITYPAISFIDGEGGTATFKYLYLYIIPYTIIVAFIGYLSGRHDYKK